MSADIDRERDLVLVTGAGGFIGGHLVRYLKEWGFRRIRAVDIKPLHAWYQRFEDVENVVADLRLREPCYEVARGVRWVFNLAADMGGVGFIETHKADCMISVLINTHMLLDPHAAGGSVIAQYVPDGPAA